MDLQTLIGIIIGTGGAAFLTAITKLLTVMRNGRVRKEEDIKNDIKNLREDQERLEKTIDSLREQLADQKERSAYYRAYMRELRIRIPKWPPDDDLAEVSDA